MIQCQKTSEDTVDYNCIGWAAGDNQNFWWPKGYPPYFWPRGVALEETVDAFIKAYQTRGFEVCDNANFEQGIEKIAIYVNDHRIPKHAARQLDQNTWNSKLGNDIDISHPFINRWSVIQVQGQVYDLSFYGRLGQLMKRKMN